MGPGDPLEQAGGDDGVRQDRALWGAFGQVVAQQRARLVAGELAPAPGGAGIRNGDGAAVRVRIDRDDHIRPLLAGTFHRQVEGTGLLRVREGDRGEVGIRFGLLRHEPDIGEARLGEDPRGEGRADAVHSGEGDTEGGLLGSATAGHGAGRCHVVVARIDGLDPGVVLWDLVGRGRAGDGGRDLGVVGGHDLDALPGAGDDSPAQVDLVAVVHGRIVRGRDHDPRVSVEVAHGERGQGRGVHGGQFEDVAPGRRGDPGGGQGEVHRAVARVAADDDAGGAVDLALEESAQSCGRPDHDREVHAGLPGAHPAAQAGGPELEGPCHGPGHLLEGGGVATARCGDGGGEGGGRPPVGIVVGPLLGAV